MQRFLSRKFIAAFSAQLAGLSVLIWPEQEAAINAGFESLTGLIVTLLAALGYITAEAAVDRARAGQRSDGPND